MTDAPRIETERLVLRPHQLEDFEPLAAFFTDPRSAYVGGPHDRMQVWYGFGADVGQWTLLGFGAWAIEHRDTRAFLGQVSLSKPPHFPEGELGWLLLEMAEGRGYAHEAAVAARDFAFRTLGFETLVSYVDPDNLRSVALAERLGARIDREARSPKPSEIVFRHPRPETRS